MRLDVELIPLTVPEVRRLLVRAVREIGPEAAYDLAARALFIEATGGLQLDEPWNRKRTPGGVFFYLLKAELDDEQHQRVFGRVRKATGSCKGRENN